MRISVFLFVFVLSAAVLFAQVPARGDPFHRSTEVSYELQGVIQHAPNSEVGNLIIRLSEPGGRTIADFMMVDANGRFDFTDLPPGAYNLQVETISGTLVCQQFVDVEENGPPIEIALPENDNQVPGGAVSLAQLLHRVPQKAIKEYQTGMKLLQKKNEDGAIEHLENAVRIDPEFTEAQTDLGKLYLQIHQPQKVLSAFQRVLKMNPNSGVAYAGTSAALLSLDRYSDAEQAARRAVEIEPGNEASHFFLGLSLVNQDKDEAEALQNLERSAKKYPNGYLAAAQLLARHGEISKAEIALQNYLKTGVPEHRDQVQLWLDQLKESPAPGKQPAATESGR